MAELAYYFHFPYSLHDQVLKFCLVSNPYWTDLSPAVFEMQGRVTRPEWSQNSDLRKKVFPPNIYRNTHTFRHRSLKECPSEADFPHGRVALPVTGWQTSLFHRGKEIEKGYQGCGQCR